MNQDVSRDAQASSDAGVLPLAPGAQDSPDVRPVPAEMPLEEALDLGVMMHRVAFARRQADQLQQAETLYRRVLEIAPEHPGAWHYLGVLLHQTQRTEEGLKALLRSLEIDAQQADVWANLGNVLRESEQSTDAIDAYKRAMALNPNHVEVRCNIGVLVMLRGQLKEAAEIFQEALEVDPTHPDAHRNLAEVLSRLGREAEALTHAQAAVAFDPSNPDSLGILAMALESDGQRKAAVALLKTWMQNQPNNPVPAHLLAAWTQQDVPERASDDFVRLTFDRFASTFDSVLSTLEYKAPELALQVVARLYPTPDASLDVLDAGCGTGLVGPGLRPYARTLLGLDLSSQMLARAHKRGVYDALAEGELTAKLATTSQRFHLITCVDTLCYFGDLGRALQAFAGVLHPAGHVVFTVERRDDGEVQLQSHGRYNHSEQHVRAKAEAAGLEVVSIEQGVLRQERGQPVNGLVVVLRNPSR